MHATEEVIEFTDEQEMEDDGHEAKNPLKPVLNRLKTTRNCHIDCARPDEKGVKTPVFPWAVAALERLIEEIDSLDTQSKTVLVSYVDVIGEEHSEPMWLIKDAEVPSVGEYHFYISPEGYVVCWLIDTSTGVNRAEQLDFTLKSLEQLQSRELRHLEKVAEYLVEAVTHGHSK